MPPEIINRMSNVTTHEVSVVRRAANLKRFAVIKSNRSTTMDPIIEAVMATAAEGEAEFIATLKAKGVTDAKKLAAMVANYRITKNFSDLVSGEDLEAVAKAAGYMKGKTKKQTDAEMLEEEEEVAMAKAKKAAAAKATTKSDDAPADLGGVVDLVVKRLEGAFAQREEASAKKIEELSGIVGELLSTDRKQGFVAKAEKSLRHIPASTDEIALTLKSAYDADPKLGEGLEKLLTRVNEALAGSHVFKSLGTAGNRGGSGDAWGKIQALAGQMVTKSADGKLTQEKAIALVLKTDEGRRLYDEYLQDNPAQRAKFGTER